HGDLGMVTADDVILALSWSGETVELRDLVGFSRRFGVGLVAITSVADSALGKAADVCLDLPRAEEACPNG
ncbi:SIS domain-containing protein, partial [Klebsiella pneumoniae]|uniref:SIS domain-containing protein n=1 Tax=Klebsiella pneumoniae TaxID=573 RepID=UPI0013D48A5E